MTATLYLVRETAAARLCWMTMKMKTDPSNRISASGMVPEENSGPGKLADENADRSEELAPQGMFPHETPGGLGPGIPGLIGPGPDAVTKGEFDRGPAGFKTSSSEALLCNHFIDKSNTTDGGRPAGSFQAAGAGIRERDVRAAQELANLFDRYVELVQGKHLTQGAAARVLGRSASMFSGQDSLLARYVRGGLAALLPARREGAAQAGELTLWIESLGWFIPAARFFYLNSNLGENRGSVPEAVRQTISFPALPNGWRRETRERFMRALGESGAAAPQSKTLCAVVEMPVCPAELREEILARQAAGQELVPPRVARQIMVSPGIVQMHRSPRAWALDTLSAPGSQRRYYNAESGQREIMLPGDWFGGDDATPGIAVCVPCAAINTPCSQRYGVLLGRFQWLVYADCRTDKVLAWDYVVRPRGSYRAEDVVNGMGAVVRTHGIPRRGFQLEGGTFNSKLVRQCIKLLGCEHWRTYSPHQKAVESIFHRVWTKLAIQFPQADMGRYRNENEANCKLYESCKAGHKDPRKYFPMLADVVSVFEAECLAHNVKRIVSPQYGQWTPDEMFGQAVAERPLKPCNEGTAWMFAPYSVERKVRKMLVRCQVAMFEDFSVPFEFSADWLPMYDGKLVRMHFDPRDPKAVAKIVLLENCGEHKAGEILGDAELIGETSGYVLKVMGWADLDQRAGYIARQRTAQFMRRETRGIAGGGRGYRASEERDGLGTVTRVEADGGNPKSEGRGPKAEEPATNEDLTARAERAAQWEKEHALELL